MQEPNIIANVFLVIRNKSKASALSQALEKTGIKLHISQHEQTAPLPSGEDGLAQIFFIEYEHNNELLLKLKKELPHAAKILLTSEKNATSLFPEYGIEEYFDTDQMEAPLFLQSLRCCLQKHIANGLLYDSKQRYQLLTRATNNIVWDWQLQKHTAIWMGNGLQTILGHTEDEILVDKNYWENNLHPDDKERVVKKLDGIFEKATANTWQDEYRFKSTSGEYRYISDKGFIIYHDKKLVRMIGSMEDITEKVTLQEKLEKENNSNQQQIAEAVVTAQEKERSRIALELHDNVNQLLSASRLYIEASKDDETNRQQLLKQSSDYIMTAIEEIRVLSRALNTPMVKDLSLKEAIQHLTLELSMVNPVEIVSHLDAFDESGLEENFKITIYRIIQEQLTNILKHAKASYAVIEIKTFPGKVWLNITDNGKGFLINEKNNGMGIGNIYSRAALYKGAVNLDAAPGKGCRLQIAFPLSTIPSKNN